MDGAQADFAYDVFLSYKSQERARVAQIARELRRLGLRVWFDQSLPIGKKYDEQIMRSLERSRVIMVCWSALASRSEWVLKEAAYAQQVQRLVPVRFDNTPHAPFFESVQSADLSGWAGELRNQEWLRAVRAICERLEKSELLNTLKAAVNNHGDFSGVFTHLSKTKATVTVSSDGSGDFRQVQAALNAAPSGAIVEIREGRYPESLIVRKPVELVGRTSSELPIIDGGPGNAISCSAHGSVKASFLALQNAGGDHATVRVLSGALHLYNVHVKAKHHSCVLATGESKIDIEDSLLRSRGMSALHLAERSQGIMATTAIEGAAKPGVAVTHSARAIMSRCHLHDMEQTAVIVLDQASGEFSGNLIQRVGGSGFSIRGDANAEVMKNKIHQVRGNGIRLSERARASVTDNEVKDAVKAGLSVEDGARLIKDSGNIMSDCG